jgi:hypothetical protein
MPHAAYTPCLSPPHKVPTAFVVLETLPFTPSGKVDRSALPVPQYNRALDIKQEFVPPRTDTEKLLAGFVTQVLGVQGVGTLDNFYGTLTYKRQDVLVLLMIGSC